MPPTSPVPTQGLVQAISDLNELFQDDRPAEEIAAEEDALAQWRVHLISEALPPGWQIQQNDAGWFMVVDPLGNQVLLSQNRVPSTRDLDRVWEQIQAMETSNAQAYADARPKGTGPQGKPDKSV